MHAICCIRASSSVSFGRQKDARIAFFICGSDSCSPVHVRGLAPIEGFPIVAPFSYGTWNFNLFKNVVGCSGPKPLPFIGTMHHYFKKGLQVDLDLKKQYGRSYG